MKKIFGLERNIFFLGLVSFFNDFSSEMVFSVMPAFFISVLKTGAGALGFAEGIAEAASNLVKVYSGRFSDAIQKRRIFTTVGYTISVFTRPFYILAASVGAVVGLRLTDRIGKGLRDAPRDALIALSTPHERSGRSFGYHRAMDTLGGILGPLAAYFILANFPGAFNTVFITAFVVGIAAIASIAFVKEVGATVLGPDRGNGLSRKAVVYIISVFVLSVGTLPIIILLLKTQDLGIAPSVIPLFYSVYSLTYALFSIPAGRMADRLHSAPVITTGYLFLLAGYSALAFSSSVFSLVAGLLAIGMFAAFTDGVQRSHLSHLVGFAKKGTGYGYLNAAAGLGALVAGAGGGYLWEAYGPATALAVAGVFVILGLAIFLIGGDGKAEPQSAILGKPV